jgi:2-octaprenyl-6-methoxyphenol hydroxylase
MTIPTSTLFDAIIVGGGPNGLTLALALAQIPDFKILIIDGRDPAAFARNGEDSRGSALTAATQSMFKALGLGNALAPHLTEMRDIVVTDGKGPLGQRPSLLNFHTNEPAQAAASMIENRHLALALVEKVEATPAVTLWTNSTVENTVVLPGQTQVWLSDGRSASAPIIIGADGRNSKVRSLAGITVQTHDHGQTALTFTLAHTKPHHNRAEEHFSPSGVCALLPLPDNHSSVVWAETPKRALELAAMSAAEFVETLQEHIGEHLGRLSVKGKINSYPLQLQIASAMSAPRTALVGDAGHVIHPLAGLGLNLGFKDCAALADCIADAVSRGEDHGGAATLDRYETWRRFDITATVAALEGMNKLFASDNPALRSIRQLGLRAMDHLPPIKAMIMSEAAGRNGNLPSLMRPNGR